MKASIHGPTVEIDTGKAADWHTFTLLRKANDLDQFGQFAVLMDIIEYITDQTEQSIVEHCGGDTAQASDVIALVSDIIKAATPKN